MNSLPERCGLDAKAAFSSLATRHLGKVFRYYDDVESTNERAASWAREGAPHGAVVVAGIQSGGYGRLNREWISPSGGLWLSVVLRPEIEPEESPKITLMAAVAVADSICSLLGVNPTIKWPNDVLVGGRKVCGILTEMRSFGDDIQYIILGLGLNVNFSGSELPEDIRENATTLMEEFGDVVSMESLVKTLMERIETLYEILDTGNSSQILKMWKGRSDTLGRRVQITMTNGTVEGLALDLDESGALVVKTDNGGLERIIAGDCIHLSRIQS